MQGFLQTHSYDLAILQALAFIVLGAVVAVLPRRDTSLPFAADLWLVAPFGVLHGSYALIAPRALVPAEVGAWAPWLSGVWILVSYLPLFEFGRRLVVRSARHNGWRGALTAVAPGWAYGLSALGIAAVYLWSADRALGLTAGARWFQGVPAALLTALGLVLVLRGKGGALPREVTRAPLWITAGAFVLYGVAMPVLPTGDGNLPEWIPTARKFQETFGLPIALPRTLAALGMMAGLGWAVSQANRRTRTLEAHLRRSEEQLAEAQEMARIGHWEARADTGEQAWSAEIHRILELDPAHGKPTLDLLMSRIHPEDRDLFRRHFATTQHLTGIHELSYRLLLSDGRVKHLLDRHAAQFDAAGKLVRVHGTVQDVTDRVTAGQALQTTEAHLQAILSHAPIILSVLDKNGTFTLSEGRELETVHRKPGEMVGRSAFEVFARFPERIDQLRRGLAGAAFTAESPMDGHWFETRYQPVRDAAGDVTGLVMVSTNVNERKQAALAVAEQQERLATTLRSIGDAVITTDTAGRIDNMNPVAEKLTGWPLAEARGRPLPEVFRIVSEETRQESESPVTRVLREGQIVGLANHTALIAKDGSERPIADSGAPIRADDGRMLGVVLVFRDQTDERRAQAALVESEARHRHIIESTNEGVSTVDADFRVTFVNQRFAEMLGYPPEQMLGRPIVDFIAEEERADALARQTLRRSGKAERHERKYQRVDGRVVTLQVSSTPIFDDTGNFTGATNMAVDVTEHKELEHQFLQAQKMDAVGRLAGGVAHDFNNLLTVILGYATVLEKRLADSAELRAHAEQIARAGRRSQELTQRLLVFSRHQAVRMQVYNLNEIVAGMEPMLRRLVGEDIEMVVRRSPQPAVITVDQGQMEQVILNLVVNARDAMPKGGQLTIGVARETLTPDYARTHLDVKPGRYIRLAVTDSGEGMSKATLEHVFEPFFTTKPPGKGTGLGLSTVYGIVRNSGGHVWVYSEEGRGSIFKVYLPQVDGLSPDTPHAAPALATGGNESILLVEDDDAVRNLVHMVLQEAGYQVTASRLPKEALELCRGNSTAFHLLLTDVVMPQMGGRELADEIRALHPNLPVIFMSGYTEDTALAGRALPPGVRFVQKPILPDDLKTQVRKALDG